MVSVKNLRKAFGSLVAVDGISLEVSPGEVLGLLGPNGAGKSTTILMMMGALKPDSGEVLVNGLNPTDPKARTALGLAPQSLAIYEDLTAEENLRFYGQIYGLAGPELRGRVAWALEFSGLSDRRSDLVKTYSGGMKRRLNIACGLIHEPKVVFLDEPTVGVDPQSRNHIFESVEELKKEGLTVIYTTHYMEEAERLCDRVGIIEKGKLMDLDAVPNLLKRHGGPSKVIADLDVAEAPSEWTSKGGGLYEIESETPYAEVVKLAAASKSIEKLQVQEPTLESVFLNLTGRSLRD